MIIMDERIYTISLREVVSSPRNYRTRKAMNLIEKSLERHLKISREKIKIGQSVNEAVWMRGIQNPPPRIKVEVFEEGEGFKVELFGYKAETKKEQKEKIEKTEEKKETKEQEIKEEKPAEEEKGKEEVKEEQS